MSTLTGIALLREMTFLPNMMPIHGLFALKGMLVLWMAHVMIATAFVTIAAVFFDRIAVRANRPRRWIWVCALGASVVLPIVALLRPWGHPVLALLGHIPFANHVITALSFPSTYTIAPVSTQHVLATGGSSINHTALILWGTLSALCIVMLVCVHAWLRFRQSQWTVSRRGAVPVLISPSMGPAVVGVLRPVIVLPAWVLGAPAETRRVILQHESEHIAAGDSGVLAAAAILIAIMPWNLALWWQYLRLRATVETDCDARVLARGTTDVRHYGEVLLRVASQTVSIPALSPAMGRNVSLIERRLVAMTTSPTRHPRTHMAAMAGVALMAMVTATDASSLAMHLPTSLKFNLTIGSMSIRVNGKILMFNTTTEGASASQTGSSSRVDQRALLQVLANMHGTQVGELEVQNLEINGQKISSFKVPIQFRQNIPTP